MISRIITLAAWPNRRPLIVQSLAMLATAAGIGLWSALLLAPQPTVAPPLLASGPAPGENISPLVNWFGGGSARLRVAVLGLLSAGQRGTALLSINGGPPKAYSVGHTLAQGVTLSAVLPHGISIDQDGIIEEIQILGRAAPPAGFVHASPSRTSGQ
ncbi:hypothetical protein [Pollutimonas subterranea]|nr:hypothetical protein [Pollutimonas subterranea]